MSMVPDGDGDRVALIPMDGDLNGQNSDGSQEVWLADFSAGALIDVGKDSPTLISWAADPRYVRYDVIRGDVSSLGDDGGNVSPGPVVCVENDSTDTDTADHEIAEEPAPG
jgi:hypothetical protein